MKQALILLLFLFFLPSQSASAHTLENETTIGAILHVSPEDDPVAGEISTLSFDITDTTGRFDPKFCECAVIISENDSVIATIPVYEDISGNDGAISLLYTFPKIGVYQVTLSGKPREGNQFDEFSLSYDVRVARERAEPLSSETDTETAQTELNSSKSLFLIGGIAVLALTIPIFVILRKKRK